ncbi:hypothetical protein J6590_005905 [Homalodisca vitripennis]|nr:hypothetical protein J6590_005905 [Homalodisca vitripennis]
MFVSPLIHVYRSKNRKVHEHNSTDLMVTDEIVEKTLETPENAPSACRDPRPLAVKVKVPASPRPQFALGCDLSGQRTAGIWANDHPSLTMFQLQCRGSVQYEEPPLCYNR